MSAEILDRCIKAVYPSMRDLDIVAPAAQPGDDFLMLGRTYNWYYAVGAVKAARRILETGVKYGYSAIAMCKGAMSLGITPEFVGIDAEADGITCNPIATAALTELGIPHTILPMNTRDVDGIRFKLFGFDLYDIVHIDADHSPEGIERELRIAKEFCSPTGLILVDDVDAPHIDEAARRFADSIGVEPLLLPTQHGLLVIDVRQATR